LILGVTLIDAKSKELSLDIAQGTESFARLSVERIMEDYSLYLEPGNFIPFSREMSGILRQNNDIRGITISSYNGVILYSSREEGKQRFEGGVRTLIDPKAIERVQANWVSLYLEDGRTIYVKVNEEGEVSYVNLNEDTITAPTSQDRISTITVPYGNAYAVIYEVSYDALASRLAKARQQIIIIALLGLALTLMVAYMLSVSITNPLRKLKAGAMKIATGDFKTRVYINTKDEIGVLGQTFNKMAKDLEISTEARIYKERVQKELELAAEIQAKLLPTEKMFTPKMDFAGGLIPATEVGGDAFDFIPANEKQSIVYLGDVTGHGVAAGIVSSIANALIYGFRRDVNLLDLIKNLNDVLRKKTMVNVFMTMALMLWNEETDTLTYVNAGHPPVLYYDATQRKVVDVSLQGLALSMVDGLEKMVKEYTFKMKPNDVIVMYSDGVPEAMNSRKEAYGLQKLKRVVQGAANDFYAADAIKNTVLSDVKEFIGTGEQLDDITVVVLKRKTDEEVVQVQAVATVEQPGTDSPQEQTAKA